MPSWFQYEISNACLLGHTNQLRHARLESWIEATGSWTIAVEYPGRSANHVENFVSLAISQGLVLFVEDVLRLDINDTVKGPLGDQWLRQVVRSFASGFYNDF